MAAICTAHTDRASSNIEPLTLEEHPDEAGEVEESDDEPAGAVHVQHRHQPGLQHQLQHDNGFLYNLHHLL